MMTLSSILDPLRAANRLSKQPLFEWRLVSLTGLPVTLSCGIDIQVDHALNQNASGNLLAVIAGFNHKTHAPRNQLVPLYKAAQRFETVCGIEAGTWVLARAGIISHHKVTTHWEDTENLASAYPDLDVRSERYVVDGHIWSSGGASPALDMMLHYLRSTENKSLALDVASVFIYVESSASTDAQTTVSLGRAEQLEPRLTKAIRIMEANIEDPLTIPQIASQISLSVRTLELLYRKHLGLAPGAYYLRLRLQTARRLVLDTNTALLDVSVRSGFSSPAAFSRAFKKRYGFSPSSLRHSTG